MANSPASDRFDEYLAEAKGRAELMAASLPKKIAAASLTFESKLPFKALSLREILIHRVSELSTAAVEMFAQRRLLPAIVLTRAVVETVSVALNLHTALLAFHTSKDVESINDFLDRGLVGGRYPDAPVQSKNVLTLIDRANERSQVSDRLTTSFLSMHTLTGLACSAPSVELTRNRSNFT